MRTWGRGPEESGAVHCGEGGVRVYGFSRTTARARSHRSSSTANDSLAGLISGNSPSSFTSHPRCFWKHDKPNIGSAPKGRKGSRERNRRLRSLGPQTAGDQPGQGVNRPTTTVRPKPPLSCAPVTTAPGTTRTPSSRLGSSPRCMS